jgi:hypothetical protein
MLHAAAHLLGNGKRGILIKGTRPAGIAKDASTAGLAPVAIGACKPRIERNAMHAASETLTEPVVK